MLNNQKVKNDENEEQKNPMIILTIEFNYKNVFFIWWNHCYFNHDESTSSTSLLWKKYRQ